MDRIFGPFRVLEFFVSGVGASVEMRIKVLQSIVWH
jgi:hypothetical protein